MADAAVELPGSHEVLDRAAGENFSVASLLLGRETRAPPARDLRLCAARRRARRRRAAATGSRARRARGRARPRLRRRRARAPDPAASSQPSVTRARPPARAVRSPDRGQPADQTQSRYATFDELVGYCDLSANPVGELVLHVFGPPRPSGSRSPTGCARRSSSPSTGRTSPRITPPGGSTCRPRISTASASHPTSSRAAHDEPAAPGAARVRGRPRPRAARRRRAARRPAPRARPPRGRGLRRRRPRRARRDRSRADTTSWPARRRRPRRPRPLDLLDLPAEGMT